jgi:plasmid stability protein
MSQLLVSDVPQDVVEALERRAAEHGRSAEAEHRVILEEALRVGFREPATALREETRGRVSVPSEELIRQDREERGGSSMQWRDIKFEDVPSREELEQVTLDLLRQGITNSDRMRDTIRRERKLILNKTTGNWNATPSDKFVNEHAWVLENLVVRKIIEKIAEKEYRLVSV